MGRGEVVTTRCFVQETMILDSQHASTIVTAATEPEQFILGTAEKSIGSASRYELCECVDPKISPRKEFCVMKILPIFLLFFLWDFVGFCGKGVLAKCKPLASKMCPLSWVVPGTLR